MNAVLATRKWVEDVVIELNLCPFARRELEQGRVRFVVNPARKEKDLLIALLIECALLEKEPEIETSLIILETAFSDFLAFNDFLGIAEDQLEEAGYDGIFQLASFHPQYQFGGAAADDAENYTNRSPLPVLHLLREDSIERAVESHPDIESIPERNINLMNELGAQHMAERLAELSL